MTYSNSWHKKEYLLGLGGLGGGAGGILIAGGPISTSDDGYQIKRSVRFNYDDTTYLSRKPGARGDTRTWTFSGWFKKLRLSGDGSQGPIFGMYTDGNNQVTTNIDPAGNLEFDIVVGGTEKRLRGPTAGFIKDTNAWYHLVVNCDTTNSNSSERLNVWINGERTPIASSTYPDQHWETLMSTSAVHYIGIDYDGGGRKINAYIADPQFIDGLALNPAAFAQYSSTSGWDPKAFALPTPNDGTTWSDSVASGGTVTAGSEFRSGYPATRVFDGTRKTSTSAMAATQISAADKYMEFNFGDEGINCSTLELNIDHNNEGQVYVNGVDITYQVANNTFTWQPVTGRCLYGGKLKTIKLGPDKNSDGSALYFGGIKVNGVILQDDTTDKTYAEWKAARVNNGKDWALGSSPASGTSTIWCDGSMANGWLFDTSYRKLTDHDITVSTRMQVWHNGGTGYHAKIKDANNNVYQVHDSGNTWMDVYNGDSQSGTPFTGTLTGPIYILQTNSGSSYLKGVKVDDELLVRNYNAQAGGTSFHLDFSDISRNSSIGKDTLNGKIEDATGGLPIYNTTDDYGDVKGSGYAADSSAGTTDGTGLVLAMPGDTITDLHASINTGSSNNSFTTVGTVATTTDQSRFYGTSMNFGTADGNYLKTTSANSDFALGTGAFTIEAWYYINSDGGWDQGILQLSNAEGVGTYNQSGGISIYTGVGSGGTINLIVGNATYAAFGSHNSMNKGWHHFAGTRDSGGVCRVFVDGVLGNVTNTSTHDITATYLSVGAYGSTSYSWHGMLNDIRIYKGVCKYNTNFTAPNRNDWTANNINVNYGTTGDYLSITSVSPSLPSGWESGRDKLSYVFEGGTTNYIMYGSTNQNFTLTFSGGISVTSSIEIYAGGYGTETKVQTNLNGSEVTYTNGAWSTIYSGSGTLNTMTFTTNADRRNSLHSIKVDGVELIDTDTVQPLLDTFTDTPTNYGTDTGAGGEVRGNYCTFNPLDLNVRESSTVSNGNLVSTSANQGGGFSMAAGTLAFPSNDSDGFYFEFTNTNSKQPCIGLFDTAYGGVKALNQGYAPGHSSADSPADVAGITYWQNKIYAFGANTGTEPTVTGGATIDAGATVSCFVKNNKIWFAHNNNWAGIGGAADVSNGTNPCATLTETKWLTPLHVNHTGGSSVADITAMNCGQRPWKYTPPTGAKSICTQNLPDTFSGDELNNPSKYFDTITYTGTGASRAITGLGFQPDFVWLKNRTDGSTSHCLHDAIRGATKGLHSDSTAQEWTDGGTLTAFNSDGFTVGSHSYTGADAKDYIAWAWDAGTAAATASTEGSITPSAQWVNTTSGFSITKWEGTGAAATIGHGLSAKPDFALIKNVDSAQGWAVWHKDLSNQTTKYLILDSNAAETNSASIWYNTTAFTNTILQVATNWSTNKGSEDHIMYCWTGIPGYSAFGEYRGNSSTDGNFIYTGFRPKWLLRKKYVTHSGSAYAENWVLQDTERRSFNVNKYGLFPNTNAAEDTSYHDVDFLSNGFNCKDNSHATNNTAASYIYAAFAEHPFKTARAR